MSLRRLEKIGALQILDFLYTQEGHQANRTGLKSNVDAASETIYSALDVLRERGVVEEKNMGVVPKIVITSLTEKGVALAEKIHEAKLILEG